MREPDSRAVPLPDTRPFTDKDGLPHLRTRITAARLQINRDVFGLGDQPNAVDWRAIADTVVRDAERLLAAEDRREAELSRALALVRDLSQNPKEQDDRNAGRTTRLILRAMIAISEGHDVLLIAHSLQMALQLKRKIILRCRAWNIPIDGPGTPRILEKVPGDNRTGFHGVTLVDHYTIEQMESGA